MYVIVGLGNPGKKYIHTRHNAGFLYLDYLAEHLSSKENAIVWRQEDKFHAEIATTTIGNQKVYFLKPQTFMNDSGKSVKLFFTYYHITVEHLILVHDDLDIPLGKYKWNIEKSPKVHNGVLSVEQSLQTTQFKRLRIGIDNRIKGENNIPGMQYVLADFSPEEYPKLHDAFEHSLSHVLPVIQ